MYNIVSNNENENLNLMDYFNNNIVGQYKLLITEASVNTHNNLYYRLSTIVKHIYKNFINNYSKDN